MSIVDLNGFIDLKNNTDTSLIIQELRSNVLVYLNLISVLCFVGFYALYKIDKHLRKPPNELFLIKLFSEALFSLCLFVLMAYLETETDENLSFEISLLKKNRILIFLSLLSPLSLYLVHLYNACLAQNLALTFTSYKNNYYKRIQYYKVFGFITSIFLLIIVFLFNNEGESKSKEISVMYYSNYFIALYYSILFFIIVYVMLKLKFIIKNKKQFNSTLFQNKIEEEAINNFVNQQSWLLVAYIICNLPIIFIHFVKIFTDNGPKFNYYLLYFPSISCIISLLIKLNDPYIKRYIGLAFNIITLKSSQEDIINELNKPIENSQDISKLLFKDQNEQFIDKTKNQELEPRKSIDSVTELVSNTFNNLNNTLNTSDHIIRLIAISCVIDEESIIDLKYLSTQNTPWMKGVSSNDDKGFADYYTIKTENKRYNKSNFPDFLQITDTNDYYNISFKIRSYSPVVFKHLRSIDGITTKNMLESINFTVNCSYLSKSVVSGGRSANPIMYSFDKKYLIKTISKDEKNKLLEMLPKFHSRMSDKYSLLCRIYGLYRIKITGKSDTHIIIMKNMSDMPREVSLIIILLY